MTGFKAKHVNIWNCKSNVCFELNDRLNTKNNYNLINFVLNFQSLNHLQDKTHFRCSANRRNRQHTITLHILMFNHIGYILPQNTRSLSRSFPKPKQVHATCNNYAHGLA